MKKLWILAGLFVFCGCAHVKLGDTVLTSKDLIWFIPEGSKFEAIQPPRFKDITTFVADDDLVVMYKGSYLDLISKSNDKFLAKIKADKVKNNWIILISSIISLIVGIFSHKKFSKKR